MDGATKVDASEVAVLTRRPGPGPEPDEEEAFAELIQAFRAELKGFDRNAEDSAHFVDEFFGRTSSPATGAT